MPEAGTRDARGAHPSGEALREAVLRRATGAFARVVRDTSPEVLVDALSTATDLGTVARILVEGATSEAAQRMEPFAAAVARGAEVQAQLVDAAGGLLGSADVARLLGITRQAVDKRRAAGRLLAMRTRGDWGYPAAQFRNGAVPEGLAEVISGMAEDGAWVTLDFLLSPHGPLDGATPLERVHAGDMSAVRRLVAQRAGDGFG